ncbi:MAG TPA: lysylphosphatidylglycerol synthase domain-containing protein [Vicinamibacterales bacterium]|nr:lysylphosphatidylglycerol synthase domain-containing protein [Vicinamibacterales bacterium]
MSSDATARRRRLVSLAALAIGIVLFAGTLYYIDLDLVFAAGRRFALAMALSIVASGLWHLARTVAWAWCFRQPRTVSFLRLARVRLAAEAFSYLTLRGIAGEPLKVVLLADEVDPRESTAAAALERLAYLVGTVLIVGAGSLVAIVVLPLGSAALHVFRAFAIASAVIAALTGMVLAGRGTYASAALARMDRRLGTNLSKRRAARFIADVEAHLLDLARGNGVRLAVLTTATIVAYLCMAAEAWLVLMAMGIPISLTGALAIETISRVASFASAFIPANLGALEAYSVAAAAAVGATAAGAPLALARRLRGVFWAGLGLLIYPRGRRRDLVDARRHAAPEGPVLLYVSADPAVTVPQTAAIAGLPIGERVLRSAFRAGYARVIVWSTGADASTLGRLARDIRGDIRIVSSEDGWRAELSRLPTSASVTIIGAGTVVSPALLEDAASLTAPPEDARDVAAGDDWPVTGVLRVRAREAADIESVAARLHERLTQPLALPSGDDVAHGRARLVLRARQAEDLAAQEQIIRRSSYKPTDAKLARFNRRMSLPISIALIRTPLTANQLSVILVAIGFYSAWLFSLGHYAAGVLGGFLSLAASVLDGCDGEIARLKYQESALGCWIETVGDYSYYIAIFVGLTVGAVRLTGWPVFYWLGAMALAGTLLTFALLIYLRSRITAGRPEKLHAIAKARFKAEPTRWSRIIWRISFVATRAAMPYGIFALSLVNLLPLVVFLAAVGSNVYWISLVLKLRHLLGDDWRLARAD